MGNQVDSREVLTQPNVAGSIYQKILVAVDHLAGNTEVFGTALNFAKAQGSELMIFTAIPEQTPGTMDLPIYSEMAGYGAIYSQEMVDLEEKLIQETLEELQTWLKRLAQQGISQGIKTGSDYAYGEPGQQICALAKKWDADLIIIGRRGRSGLSELLLGSVSNYVIHHAPCSILVVQH
ncbi:universal stress protein [Crocosphaera sp. UHCC 0190]|uniref:universal stress protein n=1 Tax=Crocosphaera sp. UHCC 0190 TaxID=3110246 RepID=UPI002B211601|nr:universal stress protein [Crocosphaera sp. UHCC 0190]MEA5509519.1 universal stress protein [Crocosphaera sp. UHCC 0190]